MNLSNIFAQTIKTIKSNAPEILTALGVTGVVTTSYLTAKASFKASKAVDEDPRGKVIAGIFYKEELTTKEQVQLVWKLYIPAGVSGALTIGCIIVSARATQRRTTAAITAYSITERAFSEYREKVIEELGKGKEQKIIDGLAQEQVTKTLPGSREVIIAGSGHVLCCELFTHRYFRSDMETLRKAQNDINVKVVNDLYVTLDEFYDVIGLPHTANSSNLGWDSNRLMDLEFSTVLSEEGEPCLAFDYNYTKPLK